MIEESLFNNPFPNEDGVSHLQTPLFNQEMQKRQIRGFNKGVTGIITWQKDYVTKDYSFESPIKSDDYLQCTIIKESSVTKWELSEPALKDFNEIITEKIKEILKTNSLVESISIKMLKETLPELGDDLSIYVTLSKKVNIDDMADLWKKTSSKSVEIIKNVTKSQEEFNYILNMITITFRRSVRRVNMSVHPTRHKVFDFSETL